MTNSKLLKNSSFSVLQTIVVALASLLLFKLMVQHLGLKVTGVWSYLASITAITGLGCYGFANALVFYIPKYTLQQDEKMLNRLINTSFHSVAGFTAVLCILAYAIFSFIIPFTVEKEHADAACRMLPFVVLSFFFSGLSSVYSSVLDGLLLMHARAKINMAGALLFLAAGWVLLKTVGVIGIPLAQLLQNIFLLLASWLVTKKHLPFYRFSFRFHKDVFREVFRYGFNFQVISVVQIISDPFMKAMITKYAGSGNTAIFDFCVRLMGVSRSLLISANQAIVPQLTIFNTTGSRNRIGVYYRVNLQFAIFAGMLLFLAPLALSNVAAVFFLNKPDAGFNFIFYGVAVGLFANSLAFPAHFTYLGTGNLKWNVINNVVAAGLILFFTPLVGELGLGKYVILCWCVSAVIGPVILIRSIHRQMNIPFLPFLTSSSLYLLAAILVAAVVNHYINQLPAIRNSFWAITSSNLLVLIACVSVPVLYNPVFTWIRERVQKRFV